MEIRKKIWPEFFNQIAAGKKNAEIRLADFKCKEGDTLILEEWDPRTKRYTGRKIEKRIKGITKFDIMKFYSAEELKRRGLYLIELE